MAKKHYRNVIVGTDASETFVASAGSDTVYGMGGDDVIYDTNSAADDFYFGGIGRDTIYTDGGNDYISGGAGRDTIISSNYVDFEVDGGSGNDVLEFQVRIGYEFSIRQPEDDKTVIKVFDEDTGALVQKVIAWNVEDVSIWMIG